MKRYLIILLLILACASPTMACFGPKLYVGAGETPAEEVLFALVTLYVQEKTGVESLRVHFTGQDPVTEIVEERVDLALATDESDQVQTVFRVADYPVLLSGDRPLEDLQFTTVVPAIRKLERLVTAVEIAQLSADVEAGESAMVVVRRLLMERRWI